ncbi:MAG TPA: carboxypeptidase-like regulatory domain-containing protein, partial [Vicinamibacteria bacterium]
MATSWRVRLITFGLIFGFLPGAWAQSQATTGVIEGTIVDESGAAVPGATVTLKNGATNFERQVQSDRDGRFRGLL